jgi:hypothetical protein
MDAWKALGLRKPKPLDEAKLAALLPKLRKGGGMASTGALVPVLEALGWTVEPVLMIVPTDDAGDFSIVKDAIVRGRRVEHSRDRTFLEQRRRDLIESSSDPSTLRLGEGTSFDFSEVECWTREGGGESCELSYQDVIAVAGLRFTDTRGRSYEAAPSSTDRRYNQTVLSRRVGLPAKESSWLDDINQRLGTEAHVAGAVRTREGTATCWRCWRNIKLTDDRTMVHHGYQRPGSGEIFGDCAGVFFPPYELSVEPGRMAATDAERKLEAAVTRLERFEAGPREILKAGYRSVTALRPDPAAKEWSERQDGNVRWLGAGRWAEAVRSEIAELTRAVATARANLEFYLHAVRTWKERPLPTERSFEFEHFRRLSKEVLR